MPKPLTQEDLDFLKANGIDPSTIQYAPAESEGMSTGKAIGSTLKAHAGGIAGGGLGTLAGVGLAPESGGLSLLIPIAMGLAGSFGGQKAQQAIQSPETNEEQQQEAAQALKEHPVASIGADITASALASGGRFSPGTILKGLRGDTSVLGNIALQSGLNAGIDTGVSLASEHKLPSLGSLAGDVAGGALFSEPSALGRLAHRSGTGEPPAEALPNLDVQRPSLNAPIDQPPLQMAPLSPLESKAYINTGKPLSLDEIRNVTSPSATSETGLQPKSKDTVTQNSQAQTKVTENPVDKDAQTIGPSGLTKAEEQDLLGKTGEDQIQNDKIYKVTVQKGQVPGDKGYVQVDEYKDGQNIRSSNPEDLQKEGLPIPSTEEIQSVMPQGQHSLGDVIRAHLETMMPKGEQTDALQEPTTKEVLPREQGQATEGGSERVGMGPSVEGTKPTESGKETAEQPTTQEKISGKGLPPVNTEKTPTPIPEPEYKNPRSGTWAVVDKVHDLNHPGGAPLADAAKQALNKTDQLVGQWKNPVVETGNKLSASDKAALQKVVDKEMAAKQDLPQLAATLPKNAKTLYDLSKTLLDKSADNQIRINEPVYQGNLPRALKKAPGYWPGMPDQKVEQVYRDNTDQKKIAQLDKTFDNWNQKSLGMSPEASQKFIDDFKTAVQGNRGSTDKSYQDAFSASRRAMGQPLPPEFREKDIVKNLSRYFERKALDNAHYEFIEKNPKAMAALGETKDAWGQPLGFKYKEGSLAGNEQVRALTRQFRPDMESSAERTEGSLSSVITSALISGPQLEVHKLVSNQVGALKYADNPYQLTRALGYAVTHIKQGWQHAKEGGVVKLTANSSLDMFNGTMTSAQRLNGLAKGIRDISTLGGLTTKLNAGLLQSYFEYLVPSKIIRANAGDVTAQRFVRRLDPAYRPGKIYPSPEIQQLSSVASKYVHGTSDIRTMPSWMMNDSEVSGFLSLAHWSVAQTSNFAHDVWEPAKRGDYKPLLTGVFGATVGGYLIKELREQISGKKSGIPSLQEIASSDRGIGGNLGPLAYNAIAAMQYSGFGGLLSQVAKYPFDFVYKNIPQGATFPLDQIATDMVGTIKNVSSAIANDPNLNWVDLAKAVTGHILSTDMQLSRIAINQGIDHGLISGLPAEKKQLSDKMAQLRRFDMVEGLPYNDIDTAANPYMNIEQQKFKHDPDVGEAAQMIPNLLSNIIQRYGSQPDVMMSKMKALKQNVYETFPSMESTPIQFFKYLQYLGRTEGQDKAQQLLQDYITRMIGNRIKGSIVP